MIATDANQHAGPAAKEVRIHWQREHGDAHTARSLLEEAAGHGVERGEAPMKERGLSLGEELHKRKTNRDANEKSQIYIEF